MFGPNATQGERAGDARALDESAVAKRRNSTTAVPA